MEGRVSSREVEARSPEEAKAVLREEGLVPMDAGHALFSRGNGIARGELLLFNQGLHTLLKAGIQLIEAIETLRNNAHGRAFPEVLGRVAKDLRGGRPLSEALGAHPAVFPALYVSTIAAGERTGDLLPSIRGYMEFQKRSEAVRKKVVSAASYPLILAAASLAVVAFLMAYVVPSFAGVYADSGSELPLGTRLLLGASGAVKRNFIYLVPAAVAITLLLRSYARSGPGRDLLDRLKLTAPLVGGIYRGYAVSKFARTLGMLLRSGITLPEAMSMSKGVVANSLLEKRLSAAVKSVKEGGSAAAAIASAGFMPEITLRMFSVGERSASLQSICEDISEYHDQEVEHKVEILTNFIEPALMVIMGLVIGAIVVLMYLPIFQLGARI